MITILVALFGLISVAAPITSGNAAPLRRRGDFLYVPANLDGGEPQSFILDTGSYRSYVTKRGLGMLKKRGVAILPNGETEPVSLSVGGRILGSLTLALDTTGFPQSLDPDCGGVLGLDALREGWVEVGERQGVFRTWPGDDRTVLARWRGGAKLSSRVAPRRVFSTALWPFGDRTYCVSVRIDNVRLPMCLDTGCVESYVSRELGPEIGFRKEAKTDEARFEFGVSDVSYFRVHGFGLGGAWLDAHHPLGATQVTDVPGLLGCDVLGRLDVLLDFVGGRAYFSSANLKPFSPQITKGTTLMLPTGVTIKYPPDAGVKVEPGCSFLADKDSRAVHRSDGSIEVIPSRGHPTQIRPRQRLLLVPTVAGRAAWQDGRIVVPPHTPYTVPPDWKISRQLGGGVQLTPPGWRGERRSANDFPRVRP